MSGKNALAFVAGLGSGYLSAQQRGRDQERQDKQDAWQTEQQDWQRQEQQQKTSLRRGLADATAPATVNESGATLGLADGTKTVYDSADVAGSDFRQLRSADEATGNQTLARATLADGKNLQPAAEPPAPVGLASSLNSGLPEPDPAQSVPTSVGLASGRDPTVAQAPQKAVTMNGKAFDSTANAKVAADAYNAPEARAGRMAAVYDAHGASDKALDLTVNSMKLGEMKQAVADKAVVRRIGALQKPEEIASFITEYPHDGHGGGLKTEAVYSADGKTWSMVATKPDGTIAPIPGEFTNDSDGITKAHITLLSMLNPEKRIEMYKWEKETDRKLKADANTARHQGEMEKTARIAAEAAQARAQAEATGKAPPGFRKTADGNLEAIPGGPAAAGGKPLAGAALKQLTEVRDTANTIANLSTSFKDDFAGKGVLGIGADMQLGASSVAGVDKDAVAWWKDYRKQAELVERHALFGAALTPTEQASWRSADIGPNMNKDVIKTNLATRAALTKRLLENTRQDFIDAGHSEGRVNAIAGRSSQHTANTGGSTGAWGPENTAKAKPGAPKLPAPATGATENGYRFKGGNPADPKSWAKI